MSGQLAAATIRSREGFLSGILKAVVRFLILAVVPASLFWFPITELPNIGRVTASDGILVVLWLASLIYYATRRSRTAAMDRAFLILLVALLPGVLAALGVFAFGGAVGPLTEFGIHMKRFGLAAALPLAMNVFASTRLSRWSPIVLVLCILAMVLFSLFQGLRDLLAIAALDIDMKTLGERATGLVSNPNDSAFIVICALAATGALVVSGGRSRYVGAVLTGTAAAGALVVIILSGSRSGVIALLAGVTYFVLYSKWSGTKKGIILSILVLAGTTGLFLGEEFQQRMGSAVTQRLGEESVSSRLQAQYVVLMAAVENPFGAGFSNFPQATAHLSSGMVFSAVEGSDSVYFDTLLGSGFLGLASLLILYRMWWKYVRMSLRSFPEAALMARGGCLAVFVFGMATVSPASVFVSPVAFFMVGSCALNGMASRIMISATETD